MISSGAIKQLSGTEKTKTDTTQGQAAEKRLPLLGCIFHQPVKVKAVSRQHRDTICPSSFCSSGAVCNRSGGLATLLKVSLGGWNMMLLKRKQPPCLPEGDSGSGPKCQPELEFDLNFWSGGKTQQLICLLHLMNHTKLIL